MTEAPLVTHVETALLYSNFPTDLKIVKSHFNEPLKGMEAVCFPQKGLGS